jgi:hypothetical protein
LATFSVLSLATDEIADVREVSFPNKAAYAARWNYRCVLATSSEVSRPASWSKILLLLDNLGRSEWLWWSDADSVVTCSAVVLSSLVVAGSDLILSSDRNGLNCGSMVVRSSSAAECFLKAVWQQTQFTYHCWWEQAAIRFLLRRGFPINVHVWPQRYMNSYPEEWCTGDFLLHCPNRSGRVDILKRFLQVST